MPIEPVFVQSGIASLLPVLPPSDLVASGLFLRHAVQPRWLLLRATKHGEWGFPKGHVDPGENLMQTALRECAEEAGIALVEVLGPPTWDVYAVPNGKRKTTVYFPAITSTSEVILSTEHNSARWCAADEVADLLNHHGLVQLFRSALLEWPC